MLKMRMRVVGFIALIVCLFAFTGLAFGESADAYTILIYLNGTDLESSYDTYEMAFAGNATKDLNEMIAGYKEGAGVNVIVQTGGTKDWANEYVSADETQRFELTSEGFKLVNSLPNQNMGYKKTLSDFIVWGTRNYPANKTALILWNHGAGPVKGYGYDELFEGDSLHLEELDAALMDAKAKTNVTFEVLGFDACLMASLEVADLAQDYAKYLVASEELEPGHGWNYSAILTGLNLNPQIDGIGLGKIIVDSYNQHAIDNESASDITLSVVDLSKVTNVVTALEVLVEDASVSIQEDLFFYEFAKAIVDAKSFGGNTEQQGYTDIIDLKSFARHLSANQPLKAQALMTAVDNAVLYKVEGTYTSDTSGLSLYFPYRDQDYYEENMGHYEKIPFSPKYKAYLKKFKNRMIELVGDGEIAYELNNPTEDNPYYQLVFDVADLNKVYYVYIDLYETVDPKEGTNVAYKYLGTDFLVRFDEASNSFYDDFNFYWTLLEGQPLMTYVVKDYNDVVEYESPVLFNGEEMNLKFAWVTDYSTEVGSQGEVIGGHYEIYGLRRGIDPETGMPDKNMYQLSAGDEIVPLYMGLTPSNREVIIEGDLITVTDLSQLTFEELLGNRFELAFRFVDFSYNNYQTELFEVYK